MPALPGSVRRRLADERGVTLIELLVATVIALVVAAGGVLVLQIAIRTQPQVSERAGQIQQGRTLVETVTRELRQGQSIEGATESSLEIMTYVNSDPCGGPAATTSTLCRVTYVCEGTVCTRTEHDGAGAGSATQVASGLLDGTIFSYCEDGGSCELATATDPTYVEVELAYPGEDGGEAITLTDGVALRNYFVPDVSG